VLVCPSGSAATTALELWDQGKTSSTLWGGNGKVKQPFANDGKVEPCEVYEHPYVYIGWTIEDRMTSTANVANLKTNISNLFNTLNSTPTQASQTVRQDWTVLKGSGNAGGDVIYRLKEGVERFMITDINNASASAEGQSALAIMWDEISGDEASTLTTSLAGAMCYTWTGMSQFLRYQGPEGNTFPVNQGGFSFHEMSHMLYL